MAESLSVGDQVKIVALDHPWYGAIGRISAPSAATFLDWVVELETILPGQQAQATTTELRRV